MKGLWWKLSGAIIFLVVLIGGLSVPIRPGIIASSPSSAIAGEKLLLNITGYNTHFQSANHNRAWLKLDSLHMLPASNFNPSSENNAKLSFILPSNMPDNSKVQAFTLIIDNEVDGAFVQPNILFVSSKDTVSVVSQWPVSDLRNLNNIDSIRFPYRNILNETIRNTFFHVALWFAMFLLLIVGLYYAIKYLRTGDYTCDILSAAFNRIAIMYGVFGLITGSIWAKFTWDTFWTTDVKLNMTAVAMLIYLAYLVLRASTQDHDRRAKLSASYSIFAFLALIPLVFVIPRLTDSLHPGNGGNPALGGEDLDHTLRMFFYPSIIALTLLGTWMATLLVRYERLKEKIFLKS